MTPKNIFITAVLGDPGEDVSLTVYAVCGALVDPLQARTKIRPLTTCRTLCILLNSYEVFCNLSNSVKLVFQHGESLKLLL